MSRIAKVIAVGVVTFAAIEMLAPDPATAMPAPPFRPDGSMTPGAPSRTIAAPAARVKTSTQAITGGVQAMASGAGFTAGLTAVMGQGAAAAIVGGQNVSASELLTLARTLYGEISVGSVAQVENVASVIAARKADPRWPSTWSGVCLQRLQFSCWNLNDPNRARILAMTTASTNPAWLKCLDVARRAITVGVPDRTQRANHYYAPAAMRPAGRQPSWYRQSAVTLSDGLHVFLRL